MQIRVAAALGLALSLCLMLVQRCPAGVLGIDSTVTNPVLDINQGNDAEITSFTVGSTTYNQLQFLGPAFAINNGSQTFARIGNADPADTVAVAEELVGNQYLTQGKANATGVKFNLGQSLGVSDGTLFFMYELVLATAPDADDVVVYPLLDGTRIGDWSLTINASDYGALSNTFRMTLLSGSDANARGVTFSLADFSGTTGSLSAVNGLEFSDPNATWDPLSAGIASVPEPGTLALAALALVGAAFFACRKRPARQ